MKSEVIVAAEAAIRNAATIEYGKNALIRQQFSSAETYAAFKVREFKQARACLTPSQEGTVPASLNAKVVAAGCTFLEDVEPAAKAAFGQSLALQREFAHQFDCYLALCRHEFMRQMPRPRMAFGGRVAP